nr:hypothetical protein [uncultured Caproiciproducens sp.]
MEYDRGEIQSKVDRLIHVKGEIDKLKTEQDEIEGFFLKLCDDDLKNTKLKTVAYSGTNANKVTATMSENLKQIYPSFFKQIFGSAYSDAVTEETKYKLSAPASRMLTNLWQKSYTKMTVEQVIRQLPRSDDVKTVLGKKLKGANFKTDVKNLMTLGGFSKADAEQYAYFVSEAATWESFLQLMKVNKRDSETDMEDVMNTINSAVVVEETPKIQIEAN